MTENGRTHEPNLRELTSEVSGVKELLLAQIASQEVVARERDRRYEDRFRAMDEKTSLALTSSEKAVTKAEAATEKRFEGVNEFRAALADQAGLMFPRKEAEARFLEMEKKEESLSMELGKLREAMSAGAGGRSALSERETHSRWIIGLVVVVTMFMLGQGIGLIVFLMRTAK